MKKIKKILTGVIIGIVALVLLVVIGVHLFANSIVKSQIESQATKALGVNVTVRDVDLSILAGKITIDGLTIDNPQGYQNQTFLKLKNAYAHARLKSVFTDTIVIEQVQLTGIDVTLEQKGVTSNNIKDILKNIESNKQPSPAEPNKPKKNINIKLLELKDITVNAKVLPVPGKYDNVTFKLDPIVLKNIGDKEKVKTFQVAQKVVVALIGGIATQGKDILPTKLVGDIAGELGNLGSKITQGIFQSGEAIFKGGSDILKTGGEIGEGIKGLFQKENQDQK